MYLIRNATVIFAVTLSVLPITKVVAQDAPPQIPGNQGVPGLLAEITELEQELNATEAELEATETQLTATQTSLNATLADLQLTQTNLNATTVLLDEALEELEREQNRYRVPRTGQDECWGAASESPLAPHYNIPCEFTGQDGEDQAGLAPPFDRFVDNGDGTITDRFTDLVWLKNADCLNDYSWQEAVTFGKQLNGSVNVCGLQDQSPQIWRIPNVNELMSLLDLGSVNPALPDGHPFVGFSGYYWTSTTYALDSGTDVDSVFNICETSRGYGGDNWERYNDAYIVNVSTSEIIHTPKEDRHTISRKHDGSFGGSGCPVYLGFDFSAPDLPQPRVIAVRDRIE